MEDPGYRQLEGEVVCGQQQWQPVRHFREGIGLREQTVRRNTVRPFEQDGTPAVAQMLATATASRSPQTNSAPARRRPEAGPV